MPFGNQLGGYVIQQVELMGSDAGPIYSPTRGFISQSWIEKKDGEIKLESCQEWSERQKTREADRSQ